MRNSAASSMPMFLQQRSPYGIFPHEAEPGHEDAADGEEDAAGEGGVERAAHDMPHAQRQRGGG